MFKGTGKRLIKGDVGRVARSVGMQTSVLLAVIEVEAAGRGFDRQNRPTSLFEPHVFWRQLGAGKRRDRAVKAGVAYKGWKPGRYPKDSYPRLKKAIDISKPAGFASASYGLFQIMGFNHKEAGCSSSEQMFEVAKMGEKEQLMQAVQLIKAWGLVKVLTNRDFATSDAWRDFAKRWNGKGYRKNNYHVKLANAFKKHEFGETHIVSNVLKIGKKGEKIRALQSDLASLGYIFTSGIDGRFGPETEKHVRNFQNVNGLVSDGAAGKNTLAKIAERIAQLNVDKPPKLPIFDKTEKINWIGLLMGILKGFFK